MIEGVDYRVIDGGEFELSPIQILTGKYANIKFVMEKISFRMDHEKQPVMTMQYDIIEGGDEETLKKDEDFVKMIGDIVVSIIEENMKDDNNNRENNT